MITASGLIFCEKEFLLLRSMKRIVYLNGGMISGMGLFLKIHNALVRIASASAACLSGMSNSHFVDQSTNSWHH